MLTRARRNSRRPRASSAVTSVSQAWMRPQEGSMSRLMWRTSVDLPEPDRPMTQKMPPEGISRLM